MSFQGKPLSASTVIVLWLLSIKISIWTLYQETYDPFRILQHLFFIQSDILQNKNWKIILFSGHNANSVLYGQEYVCDYLRLQICAMSDLPYFKLHYL